MRFSTKILVLFYKMMLFVEKLYIIISILVHISHNIFIETFNLLYYRVFKRKGSRPAVPSSFFAYRTSSGISTSPSLSTPTSLPILLYCVWELICQWSIVPFSAFTYISLFLLYTLPMNKNPPRIIIHISPFFGS